MNETNQMESWQIEVGGQIYETNFEEMTQWIFEGSLLPQDKVRRGNLRWIEANKVPSLIKFFNAKEFGEPPPVSTSTASGNPPQFLPEETGNFSAPPPLSNTEPTDVSGKNYQEFKNFTNSLEKVNISENYKLPVNETPALGNQPEIAEFCCLHAEIPTAYFCGTCGNAFCKPCTKSYGGNVKICPFCGAMCEPIGKIRENLQRSLQEQTAINEGFGFTDFGRALAHPFKHKSSLFIGAAMFAFFTFGQSAASVGGIFLLSAALICYMMANTLTFGILANTIDNFSKGRLNANFMPNFDDFSMWDDVIHPFFLSIGAYLSSFGLFILVCIVGVYLVFNSIAAQTKAMKAEIEKIPGTNQFDTNRAIQQSDEVKKLLEGVRSQNQTRLNQQQSVQQSNQALIVDETEAEVMQMEEMIQQTRKQQLESVAGPNPEAQQAQMSQMIQGILGLAAPLVVVGFLALMWGIFYFPAACAVAGYTRSFTATINPFVGLDTIKRLGFDYVKIFLMYLTIITGSIITGFVLNLIFLPFELPRLGNMPAKIVGSFFTFYFSIVFACILGYAIYKNADKLKIYRG